MQVRIKETGELVHVPAHNQIVDLLIKAGTVEPVQSPSPEIPKPVQWVPPQHQANFYVRKESATNPESGYVICWNCDKCKQGGWFPGVRPEAAAISKLRAWHCGHIGGEKVPANVAAQYMTIGKPAGRMGFPGEYHQPGADRKTDFESANITAARQTREELERQKTPVPAADMQAELAKATALYKTSLAEAEKLAAAEKAKENGRA